MTAIFGVSEGRQRRLSAAVVKAHIGVYNVHDSHLLSKLLQGHETNEGDLLSPEKCVTAALRRVCNGSKWPMRWSTCSCCGDRCCAWHTVRIGGIQDSRLSTH